MRYIVGFIGLLAACTTGSGGPSGGGGGGVLDISSVLVSPLPTPVTPTCQPLIGTHWTAYGVPTLTAASSDQANHGFYIADFDFTLTYPQFLEKQWVGAPLNYMTCSRDYLEGVPSHTGIVWNTPGGYCPNLISWLQFDTNQCNVLVVTLKTGDGSTYLTQTYKPIN